MRKQTSALISSQMSRSIWMDFDMLSLPVDLEAYVY